MEELMPLSTKKAFQLYMMVGPYLPKKIAMDQPAINFIHETVSNIKERNPLVYVKSIVLMTGKPMEEVVQYPSNEVLEMFVGGLFRNRILELKIFCDSLGIVP